MKSRPFLTKALLGIVVINALAMVAVWICEFAAGVASPAIFSPSSSEGILATHLVAEATVVVTSLLGAYGLWTDRRWGRTVLAFGLGAGVYAATNATGWALVNQPAVLVPMLLGVGVSAALLALLLRDRMTHTTADGDKSWRAAAVSRAGSSSSSA